MKINFTIRQVSKEEKKLLMDLEAQMRGFKILKNKKNLQYFSSSHPNINIEVNTNLFPKHLFFDALTTLETKSWARIDILQLLLDYSNNIKKMRSNQFKHVVFNIFNFVIMISAGILMTLIVLVAPIGLISLITPLPSLLLPSSLIISSIIGAFTGILLSFITNITGEGSFFTADSNNSLRKQNRVLMTKLNDLIAQVKFELSVQNEAPPEYFETIMANQTSDPAYNEAPPEYSEAIKANQASVPAHIAFHSLKNNINNQFLSKNPEAANSELSTPYPSPTRSSP